MKKLALVLLITFLTGCAGSVIVKEDECVPLESYGVEIPGYKKCPKL